MRLKQSVGAGVIVVAVAASLLVGMDAAQATDSELATPNGFAAALARRSGIGAQTSLRQFKSLSIFRQKRLIKILQDPRFTSEFIHKAGDIQGTEASAAFPGEVTFSSSGSMTDLPSSASSASRAANASEKPDRFRSRSQTLTLDRANFRANSTATGTASSNCSVLGVNITTLKIWVTFRTGSNGTPRSILSYGSGATNFNFFVNVSSTNQPAYVDGARGLAVAAATWHGYVLVKGLGASFDKKDTATFFSGGLYSHRLVNI